MKKLRYIALIIILCFSNALMGQEYIQMTRESGIYTIPCEVNGHKLRFIFDTGAADVHLSYAEASYMFKNGYLSKHDIVGTKKYVMADGTKVENTTIILKTLKIGSIVLKDDKKDGEGTYYYANGTKRDMVFQEGNIIEQSAAYR